jgi:hypothetical protein
LLNLANPGDEHGGHRRIWAGIGAPPRMIATRKEFGDGFREGSSRTLFPSPVLLPSVSVAYVDVSYRFLILKSLLSLCKTQLNPCFLQNQLHQRPAKLLHQVVKTKSC